MHPTRISVPLMQEFVIIRYVRAGDAERYAAGLNGYE